MHGCGSPRARWTQDFDAGFMFRSPATTCSIPPGRCSSCADTRSSGDSPTRWLVCSPSKSVHTRCSLRSAGHMDSTRCPSPSASGSRRSSTGFSPTSKVPIMPRKSWWERSPALSASITLRWVSASQPAAVTGPLRSVCWKSSVSRPRRSARKFFRRNRSPITCSPASSFPPPSASLVGTAGT